jgi:membrane protein YdbS with pleckstrin-like domain
MMMAVTKTLDIKIGKEFKPAGEFKRLYFIYLLIVIVVGIIPWYIPLLLSSPLIVNLSVSIPLLTLVVFVAYWIPRYYDTVRYKLTETEIVWNRGVWFKETGIVPFNRITNVDIIQGPLSRTLGIAALRIQTAGYSATSSGGRLAEIRIDGMKQYEELRELMMGFIRGKRPVAVQTFEEENISAQMLNELVKIRELLEKSPK